MAAAGDPSITLQDEATCSICLDYFRDPVMIIDCGHSFCRPCIAQCPEGPGRDLSSCPQCRIAFPRGNLQPNRHLANMAEAIQRLRLQRLSLAEGEPKKEAPKLCGKHYEALRLFCQEDRAFICLVCRESRAHKAHAVLPIDEAAQDAKKGVENIRNQIVGKRELLEALEEIDKIAREFSNRSSHLAELIKEVEEKCLQSAFELLQDMDPLLSRCDIEISGEPKADLNKKVKLRDEKLQLVQTKLRQLSDRSHSNTAKWIKENVVFDPETAHPRYIVSSDRKSVWWGKVRQDYPYSSNRFEYTRCVLGMRGFYSGKHYWTVDVEDVDHWAVGVAKESVERDRKIDLEPDEGIWAVGFSNDQLKALTSPPTPLETEDVPTQIQVKLNYEAGSVAFYDAEDKTRLFIFRSIDFEGEVVFPFFRIVNSSTCLQLYS
ncbi:zinc finger protein RFP-like isoform X2 [Zootoca vivipara]|uniref:zinc finger protein RFP-like isoform X2 n=1 Tax=Zootoca vivipara TaxID=8524 RepID=UPI00293B9CE0|nr:zinc finger protein RFP-like isoform X2 [Zootoca vivipara]